MRSIGTDAVFSDRERRRLQDIIEDNDAALDYIAGMSFEAFAGDRKTVDATERCISRITEAVIQIGEERFARISQNISVTELRGMGNRLRHDYGNIDQRIVYNTAVNELPILREACLAALQS